MTVEELVDKYEDWLDREDDLLIIHLLEEFLEDAKKLESRRP